MAEDAPLELREGHIHMAWDQAFTCLAHVWPSTTPGHWWIDVASKPIGELIPSAEVPAAITGLGEVAGPTVSGPPTPRRAGSRPSVFSLRLK